MSMAIHENMDASSKGPDEMMQFPYRICYVLMVLVQLSCKGVGGFRIRLRGHRWSELLNWIGTKMFELGLLQYVGIVISARPTNCLLKRLPSVKFVLWETFVILVLIVVPPVNNSEGSTRRRQDKTMLKIVSTT